MIYLLYLGGNPYLTIDEDVSPVFYNFGVDFEVLHISFHYSG